MESKLLDLNVLCTVQENRGLLALNGTIASPEQHRDLVSFREIGNQNLKAYVKYVTPVLWYPKATFANIWCSEKETNQGQIEGV